MAFVREKRIKGRSYLYLVESKREGKHVRQEVIKYLGPGKKSDIGIAHRAGLNSTDFNQTELERGTKG